MNPTISNARRTADLVRGFVSSGGRIGIGQPNPTEPLDVLTDEPGGVGPALFRNLSTTGYSAVQIASDSGNKAVVIGLRGAQAPAGTFDASWGVGGEVVMRASELAVGMYLVTAGNAPIRMGTAGNETLRMIGGKVGIGNTNPSAALDVTGLVRANGFESSQAGVVTINALDANGYLSFMTANAERMRITKDGVIQDANALEFGYRDIPPVAFAAGGALTVAGRGKCFVAGAGVTVPSATFKAGDTVCVYNDTANPIVVTQGSGMTLRFVGTANTGNRSLAQRGFCTIWFKSPTEAVISGGGVS